ncbi:MAG: MATE family efflux transporter [Prolixibacteraceae bacterium]|nr:MATE family efflux transporter [Prolixibacteraceae bacterium]
MHKKILKLAVPNIISNITIPLLGLVDMALMGHMGDEKYIGAIALGGVIFNIIYWSFGFLRMGTSGFTAQAYGERDNEKAITTLARALLVALLAAVLIIALQRPVEWLSFLLISGSTGVESLASEYFRIRIWAAPATISIFALTGWFLGMQNARYPMYIAILINVINIACNFLFIFGFGMISDGVALGTLVAQYVGLLLALFLLWRKYRQLFSHVKREAVVEVKAMLRFFKVNSDIFLRTLCVISVFTFFTSRSAATDDTILAVNSLLLQFLMFYSYFIDGFAFAGEALTGKYVGANNPVKLKRVIRNLFLWGGGLTLVFSSIYYFGNDFILRMLTNQPAIIEATAPFLPWVVAIPIMSTASYIWDGIYIGATASRGMLYSMLGATILFYPLYFLLVGHMGNHALWLAMIMFMAGRGIFQTIMAPKYISVD